MDLSFFAGLFFWLCFAGFLFCFAFVLFLLWRQRSWLPDSDGVNPPIVEASGVSLTANPVERHCVGPVYFDGIPIFGEQVERVLGMAEGDRPFHHQVESDLQRDVMNHLYIMERLVALSDPHAPLSRPAGGDVAGYLEVLEEFRVSSNRLKETYFNGVIESLSLLESGVA